MANNYYVSATECAAISRIDARELSSKPDSYVVNNVVSYYLMLNTWFSMWSCLPEGTSLIPSIVNLLLREGLLPVIRKCSEMADASIKDSQPRYPEWLDAYVNTVRPEIDLADWLQLMRFLKRFSPVGSDLVEERSIKAFVAFNKQLKIKQRTELNYGLVRRVREVISDILKGFTVDYLNDGSFSPGAAADSDKLLASKLSEYSRVQPYYLSQFYPLSSSVEKAGVVEWVVEYDNRTDWKLLLKRDVPKGNIAYYVEEKSTDDRGNVVVTKVRKYDDAYCVATKRCERRIIPPRSYCSVVRAVPKNYKTSRIIAKEHAFRQFRMYAIATAMRRCIKNNGYEDMLCLNDQSFNQEKCRYGAKFGSYATIDLSSASDSLSRSLFVSTFPSTVVSECDKWCAKGVIVNKDDPRWMQMAFTSGSVLCFPVESIIFLATALVAQEMHENFTGERINAPQVYGDDMIVDSRVFDLTCEILTRLGCTVNDDKSFCETRYRESCGVEYNATEDTQTKYWPRRPLKGLDPARIGLKLENCSNLLSGSKNDFFNSLSALVDMQHRFFFAKICGKRCPGISALLADVVRRYYPKMTSSAPGAVCDDLWEFIPKFTLTRAPMDVREDRNPLAKVAVSKLPPYAVREVHTTLVNKAHGKADQESVRQLMVYRYVEHLLHGPKVDHGELINELCHLTVTPNTYDADACGVDTVYVERRI